LLAGGLAGAVSRTAVSPFERLKILYQVQTKDSIKYNGIWNSLVKIGKEEGALGYFKGNGTNIIRIFPYSAVQFAAYEFFKTKLIPVGKDDLTPLLRLLAGGMAGVTSVVVTYPLDLVRTRLSVQSDHNKKYAGIANAFRTIVQTEGVIALYKGINPTVMGIAPYVGFNFMCYETLKSFVRQNFSPSPTTAQLLVCGGLAGTIAQTLTFPFDTLRRKMQMQGFGPEHPVYGSTWNCVKAMWKAERFRAFYRGLVPNYLKVVPSISISFVVYENVKEFIAG
jgi:solute carrier family 25 phosphate transporter 23/24/25/41